jgi:demethylmenaquinone methyltransferase/2-methoxy-6-polyprenyl-1,4-benzoquinol methylase
MEEKFAVKDGYWLMGFQYEFTGSLYSLGQIPKCKVTMLNNLKPDSKLLIAGAGHGTEAVEAARRGINVTTVDISKTMISFLKRKIERANLGTPIEIINDNILNVERPGQYDMVMANYFLNVFSPDMMLQILTHLLTFIKPGGSMVIGDFNNPSDGGLAFKVFQNIYWYIADILYWITADQHVHPLCDYPEVMESLGLEIAEIRYFPMLGINAHRSIRGVKK